MKKTRLSVLFIVCSFNSFAQLSGNYTINKSSAASATNYQSFTDAVFDLTSASGTRPDGGPRNGPGVSAAVLFNVSAATYDESITIKPVSGSSAVNTITFNGTDSLNTVLTYSNNWVNTFTIKIEGARYLNFKNMTIQSTRMFDSQCFKLTYGTKFINISNCYISLSNITGGHNAHSGIYCEYVTDLIVSHCFITGGGSSFYSDHGQNNTIGDCILTGKYDNIYMSYEKESSILRNMFFGNGSSAINTFYSETITIDRNNIQGGLYGIYCGVLRTGSVITNNMIIASTAFHLQGTHSLQILHNTIRGQGFYCWGLPKFTRIQNNIFLLGGAWFEEGSMGSVSNSDTTNVISHNRYSKSGGEWANLGSYRPISFIELQNIPPHHHKFCDTLPITFVSSSDLHLPSFANAPVGDVNVIVPFDFDGQPRCTAYMGADALPSGSSAPVAAFTAPDSVEMNDTLTFVADTTGAGGPNQYSWDISNDGSTEFYGMNAGWLFSIAGTYQVKLTAVNCNGSDTIIKTIVVKDTTGNPPSGLIPIHNDLLLNIYPNPAHSNFTVTLNHSVQDAELKIVSMAGQEIRYIHHLNGNEFVFQRENIPSGIYFVQLFENGRITAVKKLITY